MTSQPPCPQSDRLRDLLEGRLSEGAEGTIITHVEICQSCQQTLEALNAALGIGPKMAHHLGRQDSSHSEAALRRALDALKGDLDKAATMPETPVADVSLDFLDPAEKPGHLGRLGHYAVLDVIGHGGMGIVLRAFDDKLQRIVALKVLAPQVATSATARKRFLREARAAAAVRNDHVVAIYAVEESQSVPYFVMEYIDGPSLQERLNQTGPLEPKEILRIGMQMAAGLAAAHGQGLVHRDIKPANVLLENGVERVKITDFGLARAADDASLSQLGSVPGTPQYMAPEQASGNAVDHRADLFSLGSVLYATCTGQPPFRGSRMMAVLKAVCEDSPSPIHASNPEIPDCLVEIIAKLHAKEPAERFQSAGEVAELFAGHLARLQQPASVGQVANLPVDRQAGSRQAGWQPAPHRRRWAFAAVVVVVLALGLSLTEATGVTNFRATVIRLFTPDGILVVEVDDPGVKVTIEGDGDLVIGGAGPHEIRLRPGSYRWIATKDGKTLKRDLVTITRGDKQVVRISVEPAGPRLALGEVRRIGTFRGPIQAAVFTRDGGRVLAGGDDRIVCLWDVESGRERWCKDTHKPHAVMCVAVSNDGRRALTGDASGTVRLWDLANGKELGSCEYPRSNIRGVHGVAFSADGSLALLGSYDGVVRVWNVESWKEVRRFDTPKGLWSVDYSPDGRYAVTAAGYQGQALMRLWNVETGEEVRRFEGHASGGTWRAVFSPDGQSVLSAGQDKTVRLWEVATGKELRRFIGHTNEVRSVAFSRDGRRAVSGSHDKSVRVWDVETGKTLHCFEGHTNQVTAVAYSADGRHVLSAAIDGTIRLWKLPPIEKVAPAKEQNR